MQSKIDLTICLRILSYTVPAKSLAERSIVQGSDYHKSKSRSLLSRKSSKDMFVGVYQREGEKRQYIHSYCTGEQIPARVLSQEGRQRYVSLAIGRGATDIL